MTFNNLDCLSFTDSCILSNPKFSYVFWSVLVPKIVLLNKNIYNILINNNLNDFTITQFRDKLLGCSTQYSDKNLARKFIYRQVYRLSNKGLLVKIKNSDDKKARYVKSQLFDCTKFIKKPLKITNTSNQDSSLKSLNILELEKSVFIEELAVKSHETDVYKELLRRFPDHKASLTELQSEAELSTFALKGRITALEKFLVHI